MVSLIPLISIGLLLVINYRVKRKIILPSSVVLILYFFSFLAAVVLEIQGQEVPVLPVIYFTLLIVIYTLPLLYLREDKELEVIGRSLQTVEKIFWCMTPLFTYALLYYIVNTPSLLGGDIGRERYIVATGRSDVVEEGVFRQAASFGLLFYPWLPMFALNIFRRTRKINAKMLFVCILSTSVVFNSLMIYGRSGIVYWVMAWLFWIGVYWRTFNPSMRVVLLKWSSIAILLMSVPFVVITLSRFGTTSLNKSGSSPMQSVVSYFGQNVSNFTIAYEVQPSVGLRWGGSSSDDDVKFRQEQYASLGGDTFTFGTFLKSFMPNVGRLGVLVLGILVNIYFLVLRRGVCLFRQFRLPGFIIYYLYYTVIAQGVFYYSFANRFGNVYVIGTFLFALFVGIFQARRVGPNRC